MKAFFQWLAMQLGYKSHISYTDTEYFNLSEKEVRIATARRETAVPTMEQIKHVIQTIPNNSDIEKRNRSLIAFTLLTGARDSAIASMKLKHIDIAGNCVFQDAREVNTKFSKTFTTFFFPVGDDIQQIVCDWVSYLKEELLWGNDDPLFPKTQAIPVKIEFLKHPALNENIGVLHHRYAPFLKRRLSRLTCLILIRIAFVKR